MKKKNSSRVLVNILSVLFILFVLLELQIMFNYPDQFVWFVGIGALILVDVYFLVSVAVNQKNAAQAEKEEQFENITKSEKASYLLLKKCFQDLDERMSRLEDQIEPIEAVIAENEVKVQRGINQSVSDNKKVAKILIGKSKENTDALMNSNGELRKLLTGFEQKLSDMEDRMGKIPVSSKEGGASANQYQEILNSIQRMELSLQRQIEEIRINGQGVQSSPLEAGNQSESELMPEEEWMPELTLEPDMPEEEEPELTLEPDMPEEEEPELTLEPDIAEEDVLELTLEPETSELEPEGMIEPEPEVMEDTGLFMEPEPISEPKPMSALQSLRKMQQEEELKSAAEENPPTPTADTKSSAPTADTKPPMPDLGDPNKVMSPEEIAALIANM